MRNRIFRYQCGCEYEGEFIPALYCPEHMTPMEEIKWVREDED